MNNNGVLRLSAPIMVNGKRVSEIRYDFDALTVEDIVSLGRGREKYGLLGGVVSQELDPFCQFALFKRAAIKVDNSLDDSDLARLNAKDGAKAMRLARDFFLLGEETEDSEESEDQTFAE
ncbi:hypothetical protein ACH6CV_14455 [Bacillota bacterium Meth-B3]